MALTRRQVQVLVGLARAETRTLAGIAEASRIQSTLRNRTAHQRTSRTLRQLVTRGLVARDEGRTYRLTLKGIAELGRLLALRTQRTTRP